MSHGYPANTALLSGKAITTHTSLNIGEITKTPEYAKLLDKKIEGAKGVTDLRDEASDLKDKPTTADAQKGTKDLPSAVAQVGNASALLPNMYSMMAMISSIMSGRSQTSRKKTIEDSLSGALAILVNKWSYDKVIRVLDAALANNKINLIDEVYRDIVKNAIANLYKAAVEFGPDNVPVYSYSTVTTIGPVPSPLVEIVPDLYVQEYFIQANDPYPGYIKWNSQDGSKFVFTERKLGDRYYVSPQEEIYSISETELAEALDPYIRDENLTASILNNLLREQDSNIAANSKEKTQGKNSSGENALKLLQSLLGYISEMTNQQRSTQLPPSVLNKSSISTSLNNFETNMAELKDIKKKTKQAVTPLQSRNNIGILDPKYLPASLNSDNGNIG
jgi:hypothetical protein